MKVKGNHPIAEIIAKKLLGISGVCNSEQMKMINRTIYAVIDYVGKNYKPLNRETLKGE